MAGVRTRKSKEEEDGLIEQYGGQHISKYGGPDQSQYGGPGIQSYGIAGQNIQRTPGDDKWFAPLKALKKMLMQSKDDTYHRLKREGIGLNYNDLRQKADQIDQWKSRSAGRTPETSPEPAVAPPQVKTPVSDTTQPLAQPKVTPEPMKITRNPKLQQKQDGSLRQVVPDTPQAPPPVTPPPIQKPLDPAAQESFNNKLAYQEKYNADPANADKTKLGYQPVPGPAGMSILRKGVGQGAEDADPTPLADRDPFEAIRGTTGSYANQAAPLTEYATKAEAQNQERADITNLRETQERKLASEASIQEMKNKGLFDVSVQSGKNDVATQMEYNKRPKTSAEKDEDFAKATKAYSEAADEVNPNPVMGARILLDLEARGADGVATAKMLMDRGTPEYKLEVIRLVKEYKKRKIELKNK